MNRLLLAALAVMLIGMSVLGGCGGGGKSTSNQQATPPPLTSRYITGVVVGSVSGSGVDGVVIRLGKTGLVATTKNGGKFEINVGPSDTILPDYFQVDTSGAGAAFPPSGLITYNGQTYYPDRVDMPVAILNGETDSLGTIIVTEVRDTDNPPPIPYPSKDTVILGRVVRESDGSGVPNVRVYFGYTPVKIARTGAKGFFAVNLGRDATVLELFPSDTWPPTFKIDTFGVPGLSPSLKVLFNGQQYSQDSIVIPTAVLSMETTTLGTIKILDGSGGGGGGGDLPPLPPRIQ